MFKKYSFIKQFFSFVLITITLAISSCSQQQNKVIPATNDKAQTVAVQKVQIPIDGMTCMACQSSVKKTLKALDGVTNVEVSLENKNALVTYYPNLVKPEHFQKAIIDKGYNAGKPQEVKQ